MPKKKKDLAVLESVEPLIREIRGEGVILDHDLARIYGVPTKRLSEQIRRNPDRFPPDFLFQLTREECSNVQSQVVEKESIDANRSQIATGSQKHRDRRLLPYAFTERGAEAARNGLPCQARSRSQCPVIKSFSA